jgi:hypothetical protein
VVALVLADDIGDNACLAQAEVKKEPDEFTMGQETFCFAYDVDIDGAPRGIV